MINLEPETERLRDVFTETADHIAPSPVPLAAIEHGGRARRRRIIAGKAFSGIVLTTVMAVSTVQFGASLSPSVPGHHDETIPAAGVNDPHSGAQVEVVAPGQKVSVGHRLTVWLTKTGLYTHSPGVGTQFAPRDNGMRTGGIVLQAEPVDGQWFVSGTYVGRGAAGRVELTTTSGVVLTGHVLWLAGDRTGGAFYFELSSALKVTHTPDRLADHMGVRKVTVCDMAGQVITSATYPSV